MHTKSCILRVAHSSRSKCLHCSLRLSSVCLFYAFYLLFFPRNRRWRLTIAPTFSARTTQRKVSWHSSRYPTALRCPFFILSYSSLTSSKIVFFPSTYLPPPHPTTTFTTTTITFTVYKVDAAFGSAGRALTRDETLDRFRLLKASIQWSRRRKELGAYLLGDPRLHAAAGQVAWDLAQLEKEHNTSGGKATSGGKGSATSSSDLGSQMSHLPWAEKGIKHMVRAASDRRE